MHVDFGFFLEYIDLSKLFLLLRPRTVQDRFWLHYGAATISTDDSATYIVVQANCVLNKIDYRTR